MIDEQVLAVAQQLVNEIGDQADRDRRSFEAGYREASRLFRVMFEHGVDVGRAQALDVITTAQGQINRRLSGQALAPSFAELERRRAEPGNLQRFITGQDSQPDLYTASVIRRGGPYLGGPVAWDRQPADNKGTAA